MDILGSLRLFYFAYLSYPSYERFLYRLLVRHPVPKIMEIGLGKAVRARRLLEVVCRFLPPKQVLYTGIDLFEARPPSLGDPLPIKDVYRSLRQTGAQIRLYPGDPCTVLGQRANSLGRIDLLIVSHPTNRKSMAKAWFYIPRMLHPESIVLVEDRSGGSGGFRRLSPASLQRWVQSQKISKAA